MKEAGTLLLVVGAILLLVSLSMDTSVSTYIPATSIYSPSMPSSVENVGLLQKQMMAFQAGLAAVIAGTIFLTAGFILDAIKPPSVEGASSHPPVVSPPPEPPKMPEQTPEELAAEERRVWIAVGVTILVIMAVVLLLTFAASGDRGGNAAESKRSEDAALDNLSDTINEIDRLSNVN